MKISLLTILASSLAFIGSVTGQNFTPVATVGFFQSDDCSISPSAGVKTKYFDRRTCVFGTGLSIKLYDLDRADQCRFYMYPSDNCMADAEHPPVRLDDAGCHSKYHLTSFSVQCPGDPRFDNGMP
ncbi:hypothetical protein BT63DRAFT_442813 [Microthyrium microscopicum]|uniref:Uncharacterized protein n=1 Tax=Microthyrium microscopicum TaxID=703497 RepID=A0A6A6TZ99_9PEZI|nr:hypothetical protein BT63DRAFT_442813 [Microthyrium microscopicum]